MLNWIKQHLRVIWCFFGDRRFRRLKKSGLFNQEYYLLMNPDVVSAGINPLVHYLTNGFEDGRMPNAFFSPKYYMSLCPELQESHEEPLLHYLEHGWRKRLMPSLLFWPEYYMKQDPVLPDSLGDPLVHFFREGWAQGRKPSPYIDLSYYERLYPDVRQSGLNPLEHYLTIGIHEKRRPGPFFDIDWYLDKTPALHSFNGDIVNHYLKYGINENKSPLPLFDPDFYRKSNKDIEKNEIDLFAHYLRVGLAEDRRPCSWFDPKFYRQTYPDVDRDGIPPLQHYLEKGVYEGRYIEKSVQALLEKPLISIVVPVYNVDECYLNNCIRSVLYQSYPHWELCLADDCSTKGHVRTVLDKWSSLDSRIKTIFLDENRGIAGATNAGAGIAMGQYLGFLDNDDELAPQCLYEIVKNICKTGSDLMYTDEDLIGDSGKKFSSFYKPDFNRELLLCHNYVTHFVVVKKELFQKVGGLSSECDGAQDFDLFIKLTESAKKITHLPKILYHWRASESSTSINHSQKEYADEAGRRAVQAAMDRNDIQGIAERTKWKYFYRYKRKILAHPRISIIIQIENGGREIASLIGNLVSNNDYSHTEYIVIQKTGDALGLESVSNSGSDLILLEGREDDIPAALLNEAASKSSGEYLVFMHENALTLSGTWVESLLEYGQEEDVGFVGGRVEMQDSEDVINLSIPDISDSSPAYYAAFFQGCSTYLNGLECSQEVLASTPQLSMISKSKFDELNGFDQKDFGKHFYHLDLCLRLYQRKYRNIYTPYCVAAPTDKKDFSIDNVSMRDWANEQLTFQQRWKLLLSAGDPYWNSSLLIENNIAEDKFLTWYSGE